MFYHSNLRFVIVQCSLLDGHEIQLFYINKETKKRADIFLGRNHRKISGTMSVNIFRYFEVKLNRPSIYIYTR